jgi:hypothetical protein
MEPAEMTHREKGDLKPFMTNFGTAMHAKFPKRRLIIGRASGNHQKCYDDLMPY